MEKPRKARKPGPKPRNAKPSAVEARDGAGTPDARGAWRDTVKRNLFLYCVCDNAAGVSRRVGGALVPYDATPLLPGAWYLHTSAGLGRILADIAAVLREKDRARLLLIDASEDQWASWPAEAEAWPELKGLKARYVATHPDPDAHGGGFERVHVNPRN